MHEENGQRQNKQSIRLIILYLNTKSTIIIDVQNYTINFPLKTKTKCYDDKFHHRCYRGITAPNMRQNSPIKYLLLDERGVPSHLQKREERQSKISATISNASIRGFKSPSNKRIIER